MEIKEASDNYLQRVQMIQYVVSTAILQGFFVFVYFFFTFNFNHFYLSKCLRIIEFEMYNFSCVHREGLHY